MRPASLRQVSAGLVGLSLALAPNWAKAEEPDLWTCGSKSGSDVILYGTQVANDEPPALPADADPSLRKPRGGTYVYGSQVSNVIADQIEAPLRVTWFDVTCDALVVDGQPMSGFAQSGLRLGQEDASTIIELGIDKSVVLRGVPIAFWRRGAALQIHGSAGSDLLVGTDGGDVFVPGSGPDRVIPKSGDDRILYTSGSLVIRDNPPNVGSDSLDLRRFSFNDLQFFKTRVSLLVLTPDGLIQIMGIPATVGENIEWLLLADDETLSSAELISIASSK